MRTILLSVAASLLMLMSAAMPQSDAEATAPSNATPWSNAVDGLQCRLVAERSEFAAGEPIVVEFQLRNVSDGPLIVHQGYHPAVTTSFDVIDSKGDKSEYVGYVSGVGLLYPTLLPAAGGEPGTTGYHTCGRAFDLAQDYRISDPGTYHVSTIFYGPESGPVHPKFETNDIPVWTGRLKSGTIEITVSAKNDGE